MTETVPPWVVVSSETIVDCRVFTLRRTSSYELESNEETYDFYTLHTNDWANVIAITDEGNMLLIDQYRHGVGAVTVEIPGGTVDPEDPSALEAAVRELKEETGYVAREWVDLGVIHPNPALQSNKCYTFLALGAHKVEEPHFDRAENIVTREVPVSEVPRMIADGSITHALVVVAFFYYQLHQSRIASLQPSK